MRSKQRSADRNLSKFSFLVLLTLLLWIGGMAVLLPTQSTSAAARHQSEQITLNASRDNGLYEPFDGGIDKSNALGQHVPVGLINQGKLRRALYAFDIANQLPTNATILSVTLQLSTIQDKHPFTPTVSLHKVTASWGETTSKASGAEGQGADPGIDDATWNHRFYSGTLWTNAGGDFIATASAQTAVGGIGDYTWSSPQMVADVQAWLDDPSNNFGWIVRGEETIPQHTKRFETRESILANKRPKLLISYQISNEQTTATATTVNSPTLTVTQSATAITTSTATQQPKTATPTLLPSTPTTASTPKPTQGVFLPIVQR